MATLIIQPDDWHAELDSFSREHEGWLVSMERRQRDGRVGASANGVPLHGVSVAAPRERTIVVELGRTGQHLVHEVRDVTAVKIDFAAERVKRALVIDAADGSTTRVTFQSPMRPEDVDGFPVR